eukprot:3819389-Pleurochrysis_carterae.AAC.4
MEFNFKLPSSNRVKAEMTIGRQKLWPQWAATKSSSKGMAMRMNHSYNVCADRNSLESRKKKHAGCGKRPCATLLRGVTSYSALMVVTSTISLTKADTQVSLGLL